MDSANAHRFVEQQIQIVVGVKCGIQLLVNVSVPPNEIARHLRCGILTLVCASVHRMVKIVAKIKQGTNKLANVSVRLHKTAPTLLSWIQIHVNVDV